MGARVKRTVQLVDDVDNQSLTVERRDGEPEEKREYSVSGDVTVYTSLDDLSRFADLLAEFIDQERADNPPEEPE